MKEKEIHLVHVNTAAVLEGIYLKRHVSIKLIWSIHEIIIKPNFIYKMTSYLIGKYSDLVTTDSKAVKDHIVASGLIKSEQVRVIYNGVNEERFKPERKKDYLFEEFNIPKSCPIIGMMARVNAWKGQKDFLKAMEVVLEKNKDAMAILIGDTFEGEEWRYKELEDLIKISKHKERIIIDGYREDSEAIYNFYDILVLPSINPDPLPTVVLEAMACGKPIISYRHGGACEMVKEKYNGLFADVNNPFSLAEKINFLLENKELIITYGENSRKRLLDMFSMSSYIRNFSREYDNQLKDVKL